MLTPLQTLQAIEKTLNQMPFEFWAPDAQKDMQKMLDKTIKSLRKKLESKNLSETHAYQVLLNIEASVADDKFDEPSFIQSLGNLIDVYQRAPSADKKMKSFLVDFGKETAETSSKLLDYHMAMDHLKETGQEMSDEERQRSDLKNLQEIGIFYVLEYTLQVQLEFTRISDEDKKKLLTDGLNVKAGNLPGYLPLENTFRAELCHKIYNPELREKLLRTFYKFEESCYSEDMNIVYIALKEFNLTLLRVFQETGLKEFKALIYAPFGNNVPMEEVIKQVEACEVKKVALTA